ncbi:MAG: pyrimidine-nucleoside phosphorylase [Lachnospiraceae bacterium]|nr:pyrimidine-nucleoside phosphorylase [Lachnospiraceae bacterium]
MRMYDLIEKKRLGQKLEPEEIDFIVNGFTNGDIPDYQMSAFLMAVCLNGMDKDETVRMTLAMAHSGDMLDLSPIKGVKVDKHSTGGVGDKTTLVIGAMVAALGIPVAKMSGRGLGHTGGTIDKLESIPGFNTQISTEKFFDDVNRIKFAVAGQTANLAPADKKIYALRDVTATVSSFPLISSSIMSKKLASGADVIVLDVKTGSGAFMKTLKDSVALAAAMVEIGNGAGRKTYGVITDMNQPLGRAVGNTLEVIEAINALKGNSPEDLMEDALVLGQYMVYGSGHASSPEEARSMLEKTIVDGSALRKFAEMVEAQGGDPSYIYDTDKFEKAAFIEPALSPCDGFVRSIKTDDVGIASLILGGGRETKDDIIDHAVGLIIEKKIGDPVKKGEPLAYIHANDKAKLEAAKEKLIGAYTIGDMPEKLPMHVYGVVYDQKTVFEDESLVREAFPDGQHNYFGK